LIVGAGATFLAILLWSKTRDTGWILVGLGVIAGYAEILYTTLKSFGVIPSSLLVVKNVSLLEVLLSNLPYLLIMSGFIVTVTRRSPR
jgi:hypothetical protein